MTSIPRRPQRRSIRLQGYDYSQEGAYFVTLCVQRRSCLFGRVVDEATRLNAAGQMIQQAWDDLPSRFPFVELDASIVMPNHLHGILVLSPDGENTHGRGDTSPGVTTGEHKVRPYGPDARTHGDARRPRGTLAGTVGRIVQAFKSIATNQYILGVRQGWPRFAGKLWQRNYHDHIIRDEPELDRIRQYIADNPMQWAFDRENPDAPPGPRKEPWEPDPPSGPA